MTVSVKLDEDPVLALEVGRQGAGVVDRHGC